MRIFRGLSLLFLILATGCNGLVGGAVSDQNNGMPPAPVGTSYREKVLADQPIAFWELGESSFDLPAVNAMGTGDGAYEHSPNIYFDLDGPIVDTSKSPDAQGAYPSLPAIGLATTDAGVTFPETIAISGNENFTFEAWLAIPSGWTSPSAKTIIKYDSTSKTKFEISFDPTTSQLTVTNASETDLNSYTIDFTAYLDFWAHLVVVVPRDSFTPMSLYVNSIPLGDMSGMSKSLSSSQDYGTLNQLSFGYLNSSNDWFGIGDVAIYSNLLTSDQVTAHFNSSD